MPRPSLKPALALCLPALGFLGLTARSDAALIYGLGENEIFQFDSANPGVILSRRDVNYGQGVELLNIDVRPSTATLYALTNDDRIVSAGTSQILRWVDLNGTSFGFDFIPGPDEWIRVISDTGQNLQIATNDGFVFVDQPIPAGYNLVGAAYDNNIPVAGTVSRLYTIDSVTDTLNIGTSLVGKLMLGDRHIDTTNRVGFDIITEGSTNTAFLALNEVDSDFSDLYTVNLQTGALELVGRIGYETFVRDIAIVVPEPATLGPAAATVGLLAARRRRA